MHASYLLANLEPEKEKKVKYLPRRIALLDPFWTMGLKAYLNGEMRHHIIWLLSNGFDVIII